MNNHTDAARLRGGSAEGWFLLLFAAQSALCLVGITWFELAHRTGDGWLGTAIAVIRGMEAVVVVVGVWTFTIMEGTMILAERYLRKRYEVGHQEGRVEGRQEERQRWVAWEQRRRQAQAEGQPFHEPPPSETNGAAPG